MEIIKILVLYSLLLLLGCSASSVVKPGNTKSKYAPQNEGNRTGIVKYLNQGASFVRESRREDAYKQMHENCGGKYNIVNEGIRSEGGTIVPIGNSAMYADSQYMYIEYKCIR